MCAQLVVYPQRRPIFSTTLLGWLPVPYYTQQREGEKARTNTGKLCAMILEYLQEREVEINHWVLQASR